MQDIFYKLITFLVFTLLVFKGFTFINFEQKQYTQLYVQSYNVSLQKANSIQSAVLGGQNKIDLTQFTITSEAAQKQFMVNVGLFYIVAGLSVQYRGVFIRFLSSIVFFVIFLFYGANKKQMETIDQLEKYYHLALTLVFMFHHLIEPKFFSEKKVYEMLEKQQEEIIKHLEASKTSRKTKKNKKQDEDTTAKEDVKHTANAHHKHEEKHQQEEAEEEEEEQVVEKKGTTSKAAEKNVEEDNSFDSDQEEKRKFQVDDDGFSIVPKKNIKKVQETRKVNKNKKKEHFDI